VRLGEVFHHVLQFEQRSGAVNGADHALAAGLFVHRERGRGRIHDVRLDAVGVLPEVGGSDFDAQTGQFVGTEQEGITALFFCKLDALILHPSIGQNREPKGRAIAETAARLERDEGRSGRRGSVFGSFTGKKSGESRKKEGESEHGGWVVRRLGGFDFVAKLTKPTAWCRECSEGYDRAKLSL